MADTLRLHVGKVRSAPHLAALLFAGAPALSSAQGPVWNWARTLDAGNEEYVRDIAVEALTGNTYVVGAYQTSTALVAPYSLPASSNGSVDAFIAKLDPNGNLLWSRSIGSNQPDAALGVAVASSGHVVVTGSYGGSIAGMGLSNSGNSDAFITCYDASGAFQWVKNISSPQADEGTGVTISGSTIVAYGNYTYNTLLGGVLSTVGLTVGRSYAYLNAYDLTGSLLWSLTGVSDDDVRSERIAADLTNVYVVGSTEGNTMGWRNSLGSTSTNASTTNDDALFCSAISLGGIPAWSRMIDNPGDANAECNGVAVDCGAVLITGRTHNGSVFPGGTTPTGPGAHDHWFLAALSTTNGTTNWVRTAASSIDHGASGYDVCVGRNGQIHVAGSVEGTLTTDGGTVIGGGDADICIARFNRDGTAVWYAREPSPGEEHLLAIAPAGGGKLIVGGVYEDGLSLGTNTYPGSNGTNLFTAAFLDPDWPTVSNNPARFLQPGPFCSTQGPVDLNNYLVAYADSIPSSLNVASPYEALAPPDAVGALFNTTNGWLVLDLLDTVPVGEAVSLTWRSQTNGAQARMLVSTSLDGINWTSASTYNTSSGAYVTTSHPLSANARYIKVQRHSSTLLTGLDLDAVRFFGGTVTGGSWSGGAHVTAGGLFTPSGAGMYPVTYTVVFGPCIYSHTRTIRVHDVPVGGILSGGGTYCPGSTGTLTLTGHTGNVLRWERSTNGTTWFPVSNTTTTQAWSGLTGTVHLRVVVDGGACGTALSSTATLIMEDITPPVASCPASDTLHVPSGACTVAYTMPLIASTDNCWGPLVGGPVQVSIAGGGPVVVNGLPVQADLDLSLAVGSIIDLPVGSHQFTDTIFDGNGNYSICDWTITVVDTIAPVITCPATIDLPAGISCKAVLPDVTGLAITLGDNCAGPLTIDQDIPVGNNVVAGDIIHLTAIDSSGNTSACAMVVATIDTIAPVFDNCPGPGTITVTSDPLSCEHVYTFPTLESNDDCDPDTESDHQAFILETGNTTWQEVTGQVSHAFQIGTHHVMEVHRDDAGNRDTCTWTLEVIDLSAPSVHCPLYDGIMYPLGAACQTPFPDLRDSLIVTDCSGWTITMDPPAGTVFTGDTVVLMTMWVEDVHGNGIWNNHTIHLADVTPPSIVDCPTDLSITAAPGACGAVASWTEPTATDDCAGASIARTTGLPPGSVFPIGTSTVTYQATDGINTAECSFQINVQPTVVDIAYAVTTVCQSSAPILPTVVSPTGGVFSDANQTGTIDPVTGAFDPAVATPGPHALGHVFAGGCTSHDWFTINVVAAPDATIAYDASPYCKTAGSASVTLTGSLGGTFSSTAGLVIDAGSGEVDLSASTPGTYMVSYFIAPTAVCPSSISTTAITITEAPNASVNYPGSAFCTEGTWVSPVIGGTAIGEFNADPVISTLNASTGAFNPGNTIAGNYTITYRWDATGGCAADSILTPIEVHDAVWSGNDGTASLCMSSTWYDLNTLATGANGGGTWKKSSGLIVPGGIINPSLATPGTYTYWYITHGTAPCTDDTASFLITFTAPGTTCNDGLATTGNDTWDANCVCVGQLIDCEGTP
ncbi:MAG TPA: HYR domain-containing protein, partial [Flavobacteriales bacterium]|nr:HYR domain-containing protein [Flavobacteriales bacterium]HMR27613.1 HYR domain-containing protein [Flavobacteriales bacterium]